MPRPRLVLRRLLRQAAAPRHASSLSRRSRPSLPFLSSPPPQQQFRLMTTERRRWLKHEIIMTARYTLVFAGMSVCALAAAFVLREEAREREFPTPHEWSFMTRGLIREALAQRARTDVVQTDWVSVFQLLRDAVRRLEDPAKDGRGLSDVPLGEDPPHPDGSKDLSGRSEEWRRGYYDALMALAKASEHVEGFVLDTTRNTAFPPELMIGPSNPRPRPIPPGSKSAPREEDCVLAFEETPDVLYPRLLGTRGFTPRQRMDAALAYASWLEFKGVHGPALIMYENAVNIALGDDVYPGTSATKEQGEESSAPHKQILNPKMWTLEESIGPPSANLLNSLTCYASFRARQGDVSSALPIMVSILRARRSLPSPGAEDEITASRRQARPIRPTVERALPERIADIIIGAFSPPAFPEAPDDGSRPPVRDSKALCEEAALHMHIGEVMFSARASGAAVAGRREDGLAWTREAVDMAEEQLHKLMGGGNDVESPKAPGSGVGRGNQNGGGGGGGGLGGAIGLTNPFAEKKLDPRDAARNRCRECLAAGLDNWAAMVAQLAREEEARRVQQEKSGGGGGGAGSSWLSLWGDSRAEEEQRAGRWAAEEKVVAERRRRAEALLEDSGAPANGVMSLLWA
ncbi:hypothetical protein RB594_004917 [Gaeumannomyces avenae]